MQIEHIAFNVQSPAEVAEWYSDNLDMRVLRHVGGLTDIHFVVDGSGHVVLELYHNPDVPVPDYGGMDPLVLHIAFAVEDVAAGCEKLSAAGAKTVGDIHTTHAGDQRAMLRDPWGLAVQLVHRATPMI